MREETVTVKGELGLHLRAAARLVQISSRGKAKVRLSANGSTVDGKSLLGITSLMASTGTELTIWAEGPDEDTVVEQMAALVATGFSGS
jgi:phosphocarrier protein HPr